MSETPRTWVLNFENGLFFPLARGDARDDRIEVIEKAPVDAERERMLGLLERVLNEPFDAVDLEIEAALREHGRGPA